MAAQQEAPDITLYTAQTPNGIKISMALEELGLPYKTVAIDITKDTQKEPWFLSINPNGRIPALTDTFTDGGPIHLFESGSILQYLVDRYDPTHKLSYPRGTREYYEVNSWLFFQNAGVGPMQGQAHHFFRYAPEKIPYGINRYQNETRRLYGVLDRHLAKSKSGFLVGDHISIADISTVGWVWKAGWAGVDISEFPNLKRWEEMLEQREAIRKGRDVPKPHSGRISLQNEEENERKAREAGEWVMRGMKEDAEKKHKI
ncbi:glutathione S-transferase GstA [Terfezia claveryi]|nr:glutathione S-transferase GstA [Terfezia claveryi]